MNLDQGCISITEGNINSNHFYLREVRQLFSLDVFGGTNSEQAGHLVTIDWGGNEPAVTDVDKKKMIFRRRGWVRAFFIANQIKAGDRLLLEKISDYSFRLSKLSAGSS